MVTCKKSNITDEEDEGNLGDDEKEQHELENLSKKRKRKMKCQAHNYRKRRKRVKIGLYSSDEELLSFNSQRSYHRIRPKKKDFHSSFGTTDVKEITMYQPNDSPRAFCHRFNEALAISAPSSSHEARLPLLSDTDEFQRKNESSPTKCLNCKLKSRNSLFLHRRIGHQVFCYSCALIWWRFNEKCPICSKKILQVIQISLA